MTDSQKCIMVVDDSSTARMFTRRCLEVVGCQEADFVEAKDGQEALDQMLTKVPDLLVTDLNMPNLDGTGLIKSMKNDEKLKDVPVVALSSVINEARQKELDDLGVVAVVKKPVKPASLLEPIKKVFGENE